MDLSQLWLNLTDPSLLQDPETVAMQVASLTEFAAETLESFRVQSMDMIALQGRCERLERELAKVMHER